jgi:glycine betaine/choline ABC-type transport system substrate-binding protein
VFESRRIHKFGTAPARIARKKGRYRGRNSTDGAFLARHLAILRDDGHDFPPCDDFPTVREDALKECPGLRAALKELGGRISEDEMRRMHCLVDGDQRDPKQAVADLLLSRRLWGEGGG